MVRRRGIHEIFVLDKQLQCHFCSSIHFHHREVYVDLVRYPIDEAPVVQITLQSFTCEACGHTVQFQEQQKDGKCSIDYRKVELPNG